MLTQTITNLDDSDSIHGSDLELALNNISDLVFIKDTQNCILFANRAACEFLNKSPQEIFNKNASSVFNEIDARKYFKDNLKIIESKRALLKIVEGFTHNNGKKSVLITDKLPILNKNGEVERILVIRKNLDKQNTEVQQLANKLSESSRKFDELRYLFSHDLLEPVRMITSFIELIEGILKTYNIKDDKLSKYFAFVQDSAKKLKNIVSRTRKSLKKQ